MKIAIIGLGYVGLPLAIRFASSGSEVLGLDTDPSKVESLSRGDSYIRHIPSTEVASLVERGAFEASTDFSRVAEVEAILICVPTPLDVHREPDLSYVLQSGAGIAPYLDSGLKTVKGEIRPKLVVLESTTYPGTTDTELREVLEKGSGLKAGVGFHLAYSPEREDPGRTDHSVRTIPKVMGGYTEACLKRCEELYSMAVDQIHPVSSCRIAEATKLTENIFRSVNIALMNELKVVFHEMGIDVWDVIDAASTKPFGYMPFYPGPGLGGHCIPIDPFYLTWKAREYGKHTRFIELAGEVNTDMPDYVIGRVAEVLNEEGKAIRGSKILLLGIAYKPDVDDDRESPSYALMSRLERRGAAVSYNDPYVPEIRSLRHYPEFAGRKSVEISAEYDLILLATHHSEYREYDFSYFEVPIVDTRSCLKYPGLRYVKA
ncbi:nucleotide sugar dehydrogenase [Puniceicoccus vermicola]|uniref:Nucleotide sugar dehydrogenase n=1 Tax=Puniceicoccus vermicola TaxID=388746 RepID=A0A7X1AYD0_9BACT|nr:nucleotide sugar dehydrogenase [Puniceicoccus vermicola]MBC2601095.1 nucleotide sugar dehydrogenase [Puniceicoccus vermicola]